MRNEYIIINKTAIQKRIEELERLYKGCEKPSIQGTLYYQLNIELKKILSQSTPLIPEIEKAFDAGNKRGWSGYPNTDNWTQPNKQNYISNLKLDI